MSNKPKRSRKKKLPESVILVDRKAFLSAIGLTSVILQAMGDEFESFRAAKEMEPEMRRALMQIVSAHLKNVATLSHAIQHSLYDPIDPEGMKNPIIN